MRIEVTYNHVVGTSALKKIAELINERTDYEFDDCTLVARNGEVAHDALSILELGDMRITKDSDEEFDYQEEVLRFVKEENLTDYTVSVEKLEIVRDTDDDSTEVVANVVCWNVDF